MSNKRSPQEVLGQIEAVREPQVGARYRHHEGGTYFVLGLALDVATGGLVVVYERTDGGGQEGEAKLTFVRPLAHWLARTEDGKPRFVRIKAVAT